MRVSRIHIGLVGAAAVVAFAGSAIAQSRGTPVRPAEARGARDNGRDSLPLGTIFGMVRLGVEVLSQRDAADHARDRAAAAGGQAASQRGREGWIEPSGPAPSGANSRERGVRAPEPPPMNALIVPAVQKFSDRGSRPTRSQAETAAGAGPSVRAPVQPLSTADADYLLEIDGID